ncbi:MAG: hypothetical protein AB2601_20570 [Candidatus Thiodiazotropha sp.]
MTDKNILDLRVRLARHSEIYQFDLLQASELSRYCHDKGLLLLGDTAIRDIWQLGLLRADIVVSPRKMSRAGLVYVQEIAGQGHVYVDDRKPRRRTKGWAGAIDPERKVPSDVELYFHPFRYYVLYHLQRVFALNIHCFQFLWSLERLPNVMEYVTNGLESWTATPEFVPRILEWNQIAELAASIEPVAYRQVFNQIRWRHPDDQVSLEKKLDQHRRGVTSVIKNTGLEAAEKMRSQLCIDAEMLDANKVIHVLLRLMNTRARQKLKGEIGGSVLILSMAEIIRRTLEDVFDKKLREEDELGFGQWMKGARKMLYGSERVLDAPRNVANELIRQYGLDYGVRVRCYVEGDTEYGAFASAIAKSNGIELVNLSGNVIEKRGKGVAFRESLRNDKQSRIFSIVVLDGDRDDFVRAVRTAAAKDDMCGLFFISEPDFELYNFSLDELGMVLWEIAAEYGAQESAKPKLLKAINGAKSGEELMKSARSALPELARLSKNADWGERLMAFALEHPTWKPNGSDEEQDRPIIEITNTLRRGISANYAASCEERKVDPDTGRLVPRSS